jgi:GNAT superfamily N-acetyltransferase
MPALLRPLTRSDLDFAHGLSRLAGWNQTHRDWERFLSLAPEGCFLAEKDGEPTGTATTTSYGSALAWIGMVLVHPDFRRQGIGTTLLEGAIRHLREEKGITCIRLDATPEGRPLYEGLGFRAEWGLRRWVREATGENTNPDPGKTEGLSEIHLALDRAVFGADRKELLQSLAAGSIRSRFAADGSFGFCREGERANYLGPVTASSPESGLDLARDLVTSAPTDRPLFWDLPDPNTAATALAERLGFRPVRVLTRMWLGGAALPSDPMRLFGIAEPGLG